MKSAVRTLLQARFHDLATMPDIDTIMFQISCGIANGTSTRQNCIQPESRNVREASTNSSGTVRSD